MFYNSQLLSKKTALGICWLASHLEGKRLKRTQVFEVSIQASCDSVINPEAPLALRLSGQLLLGVVRIYLRKLQYLETDAKNAIDGLQRKEGGSHDVDLPDGGTAPEIAITLPDADKFVGTFGGDFFGAFDVQEFTASKAPFSNTFGRSAESLTFGEDISDVFGSRWTNMEERFDVAGDDIDRRFSAELERLRSQAAVDAPQDPGQIFYDGTEDFGDGGFGMDSVMDAPPQELFQMAEMPLVSPRKTPSTAGGLPRISDVHITAIPLSELGAGLPLLGGSTPTPARNKRQQGGQRKKKKVQLDVLHNGRPATELPDQERQALLNDRAPLIKDRSDMFVAENLPKLPPRRFDVSVEQGNAPDSYLHRPNAFTILAPEYLELFQDAYATARPSTAQHAHQHDAPFEDNDQQPVPADDFYPPPSPSAHYSDGYAPSGGTMDTSQPFGGGNEDPIEPFYGDDDGGYDAGEVNRPAHGGLDLRGLSGGEDSLDEDASENVDINGDARDGFTHRTRAVLDHLQHRFEISPPGLKKRRPSEGTAAISSKTVDFDDLVSGRNRLEASRLFFEMLVLYNKGFVDLEQPDDYGNIAIKPLPKMTS